MREREDEDSGKPTHEHRFLANSLTEINPKRQLKSQRGTLVEVVGSVSGDTSGSRQGV